jgi:hypothetical protein
VREINADFGAPTTMDVAQIIYRLEQRTPVNNNVEQYLLNACDVTLLNDAKILISKSWKGATPTQVARDALNYTSPTNAVFEGSQPTRDYIAENLHPFQVIGEQADVALASGGDPSFLHFMTYEDLGTHYFRSLRQMTQGGTTFKFTYGEKGVMPVNGWANPEAIMQYAFPCDFDVLSDYLNAVDDNGGTGGSGHVATNSLGGGFQFKGGGGLFGLGTQQTRATATNLGTSSLQDTLNYDVETHALLRQARMGLLEQDKVALRMTVPWNPILHVGKMIDVLIINKKTNGPDYGSGLYLISALTHTCKHGGFGVTTLDCISKTVGHGEV